MWKKFKESFFSNGKQAPTTESFKEKEFPLPQPQTITKEQEEKPPLLIIQRRGHPITICVTESFDVDSVKLLVVAIKAKELVNRFAEFNENKSNPYFTEWVDLYCALDDCGNIDGVELSFPDKNKGIDI